MSEEQGAATQEGQQTAPIAGGDGAGGTEAGGTVGPQGSAVSGGVTVRMPDGTTQTVDGPRFQGLLAMEQNYHNLQGQYTRLAQEVSDLRRNQQTQDKPKEQQPVFEPIPEVQVNLNADDILDEPQKFLQSYHDLANSHNVLAKRITEILNAKPAKTEPSEEERMQQALMVSDMIEVNNLIRTDPVLRQMDPEIARQQVGLAALNAQYLNRTGQAHILNLADAWKKHQELLKVTPNPQPGSGQRAAELIVNQIQNAEGIIEGQPGGQQQIGLKERFLKITDPMERAEFLRKLPDADRKALTQSICAPPKGG